MLAVARYEFRMQLRRPAVWVVLAVACAFLTYRMLAGEGGKGAPPPGLSVEWPAILRAAAHRSILENFFLPLAFGILLADRMPRDRRLNTAELLDSTPLTPAARLWGKLVGAGAATALPIFAYAMAVTGYFAATGGTPGFLAAGPLAFVAITLPALAFAGAFSIACTEVIWTPLYMLLFTGYWFWGNLVGPNAVPTLSCTLLSPVGGNVSAGLFGGTALYAGSCGHPVFDPGPVEAVESLAALGCLALLAMVGGQALIAWRRSTR